MALRELFNKVAEGVEEDANLIAERIVQLGGKAEGTAHAVDGGSSLDGYRLASADGNGHIDALRRRSPTSADKRLLFFSEVTPEPEESEFSPLLLLFDPDLPPEEQVEQDELRELLLEAIEMLPSHYRAVVLLSYTHQLSFREIGQELGVPVATAKTYFSRAKKPLRARLSPEFAHERSREEQ